MYGKTFSSNFGLYKPSKALSWHNKDYLGTISILMEQEALSWMTYTCTLTTFTEQALTRPGIAL